MIVLVDTNLLCRLTFSLTPKPADTGAAKRALRALRTQGHTLALTLQNIFEFWSVATRPMGAPPAGANGLGMSPDRADRFVSFFLRHFQLLLDSDQHLPRWRALIRAHSITGHNCHDVRPVASMEVHNVTNLLTFNTQDLCRFAHINLIDPHSF